MNSKRKLTLLGFAAAMGCGLLAADAHPAAADPPSHAKAWGWRRNQSNYRDDQRCRDDYG